MVSFGTARPLVALAALAALLVARPALGVTVEARVDRDAITLGEVVNLEIELDASGGRVGSPEGDDFAVIGHSTFSRVEIVQGRRSQTTTTTLTLRPTRAGTLTIGRVPIRTSAGVTYTQPVTVTVTESAGGAAGAQSTTGAPGSDEPVRPRRSSAADSTVGGRRAPPEPLSSELFAAPLPRATAGEPFIVATVTSETPIAGQQVLVDYILFTPTSALGIDAAELTEPEFSNAWFMDVTEARTGRGFAARLGARRVGTELFDAQVLRSYIVVPLEAGEWVIPAMGLDLAIRGFARQRGTRSVRSTPLALDVGEAPEEGKPPHFRAQNIGALEFSVAVDSNVARVGDAVNVTMTARGTALPSRLRLPDVPDVDGARVYPPSEDDSLSVGADLWLEGTRRRSFAVVPTREGTVTVPAISFAAYDPFAQTYRTWTSVPIEIAVRGVNPGATVAEEPETINEPEDVWIEALPPLRELRGDVRSRGRMAGSPVYWGITAAPALCYALVVGIGFLRRRRAVAGGARRARSAGRDALRALSASGDEGASTVLIRYLEDAFDAPARGLTRERLRRLVRERAGEDAAAAVVVALERADAARFGGAAGDVEGAVRDAIARVEEGRQ